MTTRHTCEACREALAAHDPGDGGLQQHHASCEACRAFAGDVDRLAALARELPRTAPRLEGATASPRLRWRGLALAAALLLACGAAVWGLTRDRDAGPPHSRAVAGAGAGARAGAEQQPDLFAALDRAWAVWSPRAAAATEWSGWLELPGVSTRADDRMELLEGAFEPRDLIYNLTSNGGGER
jgi:hypothetical protein